MDKSMIPILVALVAIVAAGAALALHGGGVDEGGEVPSGYPPEFENTENEKPNPIDPENEQYDPENEQYVRSIRISGPDQPVTPGNSIRITVYVSGIDFEDVELYVSSTKNGGVEVPLSKQFAHEFNYESGSSTIQVTIIPPREWSDDFTVTAKAGDMSASAAVIYEKPSADVPGASVPGASPALETYLVLAPGESKSIGIPPGYLYLLSDVQWSSSDPSVCEASADPATGTVTAVAHKAGECDLTASLGFYSAVCHVTVG